MRKELFIASPVYGGMFVTEYVDSLFNLTQQLERKKIPSMWFTATSPNVAESRNAMLSTFYFHSKSTDLLFIDADMGYPPALIGEMMSLNKPVVGVASPKRTMSPEGNLSFVLGKLLGPTIKGFAEVEYCGTGVMLISRDCITKMIERIPQILDTSGRNQCGKTFPKYLRAFDPLGDVSEDVSFCVRWRSCGGEIWANTAHPISHVGQFSFTASYDARKHSR